MQTIIDYMKNTYDKTALFALTVIGALLIGGFFVSLILAIISSCKKAKIKRLNSSHEETVQFAEPPMETVSLEETANNLKTEENGSSEEEPAIESEKRNDLVNKPLAPKWRITVEGGFYSAELLSDDAVLLRSSTYTSLSGVKSAIVTIKNNLAKQNYAETVEGDGKLFKVFSASGKVIATGIKRDLRFDCISDLKKA
ncbi:MAG: hypothetical protein J5836_02195, partial [Clostridia bacterium]|nr:hypothetical protein [Clostridia bacterium]